MNPEIEKDPVRPVSAMPVQDTGLTDLQQGSNEEVNAAREQFATAIEFLSKGADFCLARARSSGRLLGLKDDEIRTQIGAAFKAFGLEKMYESALAKITGLLEDRGTLAIVGEYLGYSADRIAADRDRALEQGRTNRLEGYLKCLSNGEVQYLNSAHEVAQSLRLDAALMKERVVTALSVFGLEAAYNRALGYIEQHGDNRYDYVAKEVAAYRDLPDGRVEEDLAKAYRINVRVRYEKALERIAEGYLFFAENGQKAGVELGYPAEDISKALAEARRIGLPKAYQMKLVQLQEGTSGGCDKFAHFYKIHEFVDGIIEEIRALGNELGYDETVVQAAIDAADRNRDQRRHARPDEADLFS